ncbi:mechanosensitive ion channel family protein [Mucilaginibacter jinjuensis]|uniref:Mechanosensitive ion channel family protein n=1 Tax=Mucilaginibacter jinjuensis TaxID=1176721 RepID=A0ABY7T3E8_9SPHI|nr:mechanosensitive ion channel family protein [Mucilaginibacter jinjuensis]WCT10236.1 mechanosensitive ion channel family protein [Mucilaginibacter jinjuensis]
MKNISGLLFICLLNIHVSYAQPRAIAHKTDSINAVKQMLHTDSLRKNVKGFPVEAFHDTLFYIYAKLGSFTAEVRAKAVSKRIEKLADDYAFSTDSLKITQEDETSDIAYKDQLLVSIFDQDASLQNTTKDSLALKLKNKIGKAVIDYQVKTGWKTLLKETLLALLVVLVVVLLIYIISRAFKWFVRKGHALKGKLIKGVKINNYEVLNTDQEFGLLSSLVNLIKWVTIIVVIYLALPVMFGLFPFTQDISNQLLAYFLSPLKRIGLAVWDYVPNFITILVLVIIFRYVLRFFAYLKNEIEKGALKIPGFYADWANPTYQIVKVLTLAFMLIVIFPYMPGSDSPIFKGVSVFMGVLFTFGSAGALSNIVAGLVLTYMRAFKIGDRVQIGEITGDIFEKTILVTRIRTIQNEIVSIPNSTVMSSHTKNFSSEASEKGLIVYTTVTIGYDAPWRQVHQLLIDAALDTPMIEQEPTPYVLQTSLDDYYVSYRINAYTKEANKQSRIYSALHANIQDHFNKAGVEIMSPHYKALRDGNAITIPTDYLDKDYVQPAFQTESRDKSQETRTKMQNKKQE